MLHWYLEDIRCSNTWKCYPNLQNQVIRPCLQNPEGFEKCIKEIQMYLSQHLDFQAPQRCSRTSLLYPPNTPSTWLAQITDTMPTETLTLNINSQNIWLQVSNQPTIVNLISKYESFIHSGCLLGIFNVQFILLRTPWNRKGTSLPPNNEQAEAAHGWWDLLRGPCFHPQDCEDPDSLLSTLLTSQGDWPEPLQM